MDAAEHGRTLHREFVGMLFALAIAQVAVRSEGVVNSPLTVTAKLPALTHLLLGAIVIAASWVGWGRSNYSFSPVRHVFTNDFVELLIDLWLVGIYFFIVQGAESVVSVNGVNAIQGSVEVEALWVMVMFWTYLAWDVHTKWGEWRVLFQRGWSSLLCGALGTWTFLAIGHLRGISPVVLGDLALVALVLLFRAMKLKDLAAHTAGSWRLIAGLAMTWGALTFAATSVSTP
jgi:hypothetical protein